jgi:glycosyltransferase involved in cell wall biosynthesis
MHIGLVIYGSLDTLTGGYIYDRYLVEYLRGRQHTVDVLSLPRRNYVRHLGDNFSVDLYRRLRNATYDILLQDGLNHPSLLWMNRRLRRQVSYPLVAIVHQVLCRQSRSRWQNLLYCGIERTYFSAVDAQVFNSDTTARNIRGLVGSRQPAIVAYPAGDRLGCLDSPEIVRTRAQQPGPLRLVFVGNLLPDKGLGELLQALAAVSFEKWHLTVVGSLSLDRAYVETIRRLIVQLDLSRQVTLTGQLDGGDLASRLEAGQLFAMPFSCEGFGMACLEAMAFGLPVIASTEGAAKEFVRPGENGFLVSPDDFNSLRACIESLFSSRQQLARIGQAALDTFHKHPTWNQTLQKIEAFLKNLRDH